MSETDFFDQFIELKKSGESFVAVTMVDAIGSTPQDAGSRMIVNEAGLLTGTVGGGKIEGRAIKEAQLMLEEQDGPQTKFFEWNLQRDIGMTCGGVVKLFFEKVNQGNWQIVIFGAGHVTQSLIRLLMTLPCTVTCTDPRQEWLDKLPRSSKVKTIQSDNLSDYVSEISDDSFVLSMTKGHALDFPVLLEIFNQNRKFPFLGVIGSKSKAAILRKELSDAGIPKTEAKFTCPVGLPIGTNHLGEIAVSIVAQLLEVRDSLKAK